MQWWPFEHSWFIKLVQKLLGAETLFMDSDRKLGMASLWFCGAHVGVSLRTRNNDVIPRASKVDQLEVAWPVWPVASSSRNRNNLMPAPQIVKPQVKLFLNQYVFVTHSSLVSDQAMTPCMGSGGYQDAHGWESSAKCDRVLRSSD